MSEMKQSDRERVICARRNLHSIPEPSGYEKKTKAFIIDFLTENTDLEVRDMGRWLYAKHDEGAEETAAVRADFDAVCVDGTARHLCGHDGHTASLLGLALLLTGKRIGRNVILLFQHAEENGEGAAECLKLFESEKVDLVLGAHNIPGIPLGTVVLKRGTFACASCGMEISMRGTPTHAAYPENGRNPAFALAKLTLEVPKTACEIEKKHGVMTLSTTVGLNVGERAFGVAASSGSLLVTLRSERTEALDELVRLTGEAAARLADDDGLTVETKLFDVFPATVNDDGLISGIERVCEREKLPYLYIDVPFRWSEDFGHYGSRARACFIGIGSGEETAPLHTDGYEYPDELAVRTAEVWKEIIGIKHDGES